VRSAVSYDGFHMRHFQHLSDESLEVLVLRLSLAERSGILPTQLSAVMVALLAKEKGGFRPIGIFPSVYRLWGRARRPLAEAWEARFPRDYWAAGRHRGAMDCVWRQTFRSEAGVRKGDYSATVLWDMFKYYELIDLEALELRAQRHNFPLGVLNICLAACRSARYMCLSGIISGPLRATHGVIAGCSMATTLIRVYALDAFDTVPRSMSLRSTELDDSEFSSFDAYIDDTSLLAIGYRLFVLWSIVNMASLLLAGIRQLLGSKVAIDKVAFV